MNAAPKVSVIVPVYKTEACLENCLRSILDQSYKNIEVIAVNDVSPDNSQRIIDSFARSDSRIVPVEHQANHGLHVSRMTGFRNATGDYIAYVDSDDWIPPHALETALGYLLAHAADFVRFNYRLLDPNNNTLPDNFSSPTKATTYSNGCDYLDTKFYPTMWSYVHSRKLWEQALPFFPEDRFVGEDNLTSFILAFFAGKCVSIPERLYHYVMHPDSLMRQGSLANARSQIDDRHRILVLLDEFLRQHENRARLCYGRLVQDNFGVIIDHVLPQLEPGDREKAALYLVEKFGPLIREQGYGNLDRYRQTRQALEAFQTSIALRLFTPIRRTSHFVRRLLDR